jgi:hypothetical protein
VKDETSGSDFYVNSKTGEANWTLDEEVTPPEPVVKAK